MHRRRDCFLWRANWFSRLVIVSEQMTGEGHFSSKTIGWRRFLRRRTFSTKAFPYKSVYGIRNSQIFFYPIGILPPRRRIEWWFGHDSNLIRNTPFYNYFFTIVFPGMHITITTSIRGCTYNKKSNFTPWRINKKNSWWLKEGERGRRTHHRGSGARRATTKSLVWNSPPVGRI